MVRISVVGYSVVMEAWMRSTLKRCPLFRGLSNDRFDQISGLLSVGVHSFHAGSQVAFRGDAYEDLLIILSGYLNGEFRDYSGKVLKVETLHAPDTVASAVLFAPENVLPVDLVAVSDVDLISLSRRVVLTLFHKEEQILLNYLSDNGQKLTLLAEKLRFIQFSTIKEKIANYLLDLSKSQGTETPELRITKEKLAEVFGVTRPSLSRGFQQLCDAGVICQEGSLIRLLQRRELEFLVHKEEKQR